MEPRGGGDTRKAESRSGPGSRRLEDETGLFRSRKPQRSESAPLTSHRLRARQYKWTGLHLAAQNGHVEVARLLVEHTADVNAANKVSQQTLFPALHPPLLSSYTSCSCGGAPT